MDKLTRREVLAMLLVLAAAGAWPRHALAKDGDSGGGGGNSGSGGGGGDSDSDSDSDSGGGGDNSGSGGGGDDGDGEDDGDGDDDRGRNRRGRDEDDARKAVKDGKAISLREASRRVAKQYGGRIIDAKLKNASNGLYYEFRIVSGSGRVRKVSMDAVTGRFVGLLGF